MTEAEIRAQIAEWRGKRALPAAVAAGNGWEPSELETRTCAAKIDGKWAQVPFLTWKAHAEAEADANIERLAKLLP